MSFYKTSEEILEKMIESVDSRYSTVKGTWLWELLKAVSLGLSDITAELEELSKKFRYKLLAGDELDDYVENWSYIKRKQAATAGGEVLFKAKHNQSGTVPAGAYVASKKASYITLDEAVISEPGGEVSVAVECSEYGEVGNCEKGGIDKVVSVLPFIESVTNLAKITGGEDREGDEELKARYERAIKKTANAGNKAYYEELALSVAGVGAAFCIGCPKGVAGTADLYILNTDGDAALPTLIDEVQSFIDPNKNGDGAGEAAVGAIVTVKTPQIEKVSVSVSVTMAEGYSTEGAEEEMRNIIDEYLRDAFTEGIVRYNRIGKCILEAEGAKDYKELLVNGGTENLTAGEDMKLFRLGDFRVKDVVL